MRSEEPPKIARWLLSHFGSSPNNTAVIGDLDERYRQRCSGVWYWRQVMLAIVVSTFKGIVSHKLLALRALIVGWFVFWFLYGRFIDIGVQVLSRIFEDSLHRLGPDRMIALWLERSYHYAFLGMCTIGFCLVGVLSGGIVSRLHRRYRSMVLLHASSVLLDWIVLGVTKNPESLGVSAPYFWMNIAIMTLGILFGGILCNSHPEATQVLHESVTP